MGGEVWECGLAHPAVLEAAGLAGWRPVSAMPPVRRDLSVAVQADDTVEDLGDRVRDRFGSDAVTRAVLLGRDQGLTVPLLPD